MQRRTLLKLGVGGAVALGLVGGLAAIWTPGLEGTRLTPGGRKTMGALALALLDGSLKPADLDKHLDALDALFAALPPAVRAEVAQLLGLIVNAPGRLGLLGQAKPLHEASVAELQALMEGLRHSRLAVRQQVYFALRELHCAAYFTQPSSWVAMGYPGPRDI